jgi:hypothetical protein
LDFLLTPTGAATAASSSHWRLTSLLRRYSAQLLAQVPFDTLQAEVSNGACCVCDLFVTLQM